MDFEYSSEQSMLKDSVDRLIEQRFAFEARTPLLSGELGWSRDNWRQFAEMGLLGLPFAEADGGFGGGPIETMIVMEAFGRGLVLEPYLTTVVLSGAAIRAGASEARRAPLLTAIASGDKIVAFAHAEAAARYHLSFVATRAEKRGAGWTISGRKCGVLQGAGADEFLVSARGRGGDFDTNGVTLFLVPANAGGVRVTPYAQFDGSRAAMIDFDAVEVSSDAALGEPDHGLDIVERAVDEAVAAVCAEAVGVMDRMLGTTVEYLKTRNQFGGPISRFQALQHRAAEMFIATEQSRSMAIYAATNVRAENSAIRRRVMSQAKIQIGKSARFVGQQAVQLHGGIGITEEYVVGHLFRRAAMIERQFGDVDHHLARLEALEDQEQCMPEANHVRR